MADDFTTGLGLRLRRGQTTPIPASETTYVDVARLKSLRIPNIEKEFVEEEVLDQVGALVASGGQKAQDCEFGLVFDAGIAQHLALISDAQATTANARRWWQIVLPNGTSYPISFQGEVMSFTWDDADRKKMIAAKVMIKVNGAASYGS